MELEDLEKIDGKKMYREYDRWPEIARESFEKSFKKFEECGTGYLRGGRLQEYTFEGKKGILITTADLLKDSPDNRPQEDRSIYGKTIFIDHETKSHMIFSKGHRNAQGLFAKDNIILSTEHGPKGGDEININHQPQKKIKNFGWPIASYGEHYYKNYSKEILDQAPLNKSHKKYGLEEPIKYFVPSIGISEIISLNVNDKEFLVGAMGNEIAEQDLGLHFIKLGDKKKK